MGYMKVEHKDESLVFGAYGHAGERLMSGYILRFDWNLFKKVVRCRSRIGDDILWDLLGLN